MKKAVYIVICSLILIFLAGCHSTSNSTLKIIVPSGTPSIIIARMLYEEKGQQITNHQIVHGSDPLVAAFTSNSHDIIYAPTNLGALMYQYNSNYRLAAVVVWGNNFIVSRKNQMISQISDLSGKQIYTFGRNQTPDIVLKTVFSHYDMLRDVEIEYGSDVTTSTSMFLAGQTDIILTAEPSLSLIKKTMDVDVIDLQDEWFKISGENGYPQVGIFINKENYESKQIDIDQYLEKVEHEINDMIEKPAIFSQTAVLADESFSLLGASVIESAIQSTRYLYKTAQQSINSCQLYFNQILVLNPNLIGGLIPDGKFYKQE